MAYALVVAVANYGAFIAYVLLTFGFQTIMLAHSVDRFFSFGAREHTQAFTLV